MGEIQTKVWARDDAEHTLLAAQGIDPTRIYHTNDLVKSDNVYFAATGITTGDFLRGVQYGTGGARTHSVVMRSTTGTIRHVDAYHRWDKLMQVSDIDYTDTTP